MEKVLERQLEQVANRFRSWRFAFLLFLFWAALALIGLFALSTATQNVTFTTWLVGFLVCVAITVGVSFVVSRNSFSDRYWIAKRIENVFPTLNQRLITIVERTQQKDETPADYFQLSLLRETLVHARSQDWREALSLWKLRSIWLGQCLALAAMLLVWGNVFWKSLGREEATAALAEVELPKGNMQVEPGDIEVEKGSNVVVTARFADPPNEANLMFQKVDGGSLQTQNLKRNLKDPIFGGVLLSVSAETIYRVAYDGKESPTYRIKVFEYPKLMRSDAKVIMPSYVGTPEKTIEDTRRVSVPEGTKITWILHLNKAVAEAVLVNSKGVEVAMATSLDSPNSVSVEVTPVETEKWKLRLKDTEGRVNKLEEELIAKVTPNQPPSIKLVKASDLRVSPLEEVNIGANLRDDFGVQKIGLAYSIDGNEPVDVPLAADAKASKKVDVSHLLPLENLQAKPDQLISYFIWAEDVDAAGNARRVESDLFFAEVRPFEEIFREGESQTQDNARQQQQQQNGGAAQQAEELAELQKQIIVSLWNILRREQGEKRSANFAQDLEVIKESQGTALEKLAEVAQAASAPNAEEIVSRIQGHMDAVAQSLTEAIDKTELTPVRKAQGDAQSAYAGLLQLRAREHEIAKANQSQSSSRSSSAQRNQQQQLEQLELKNDPNRYETQQTPPETEQEQQAQEVRQAVNRLKELARRQEDINKELQKLQSELQAAETPEKKQEIEEQLKRLRDAQEELLRDTDELSERLDDPSQQEALESARQQIEQARENVKNATDSLARNEPNEALSAGTRAEQQFEQMRDELRQQSANQFSEKMKEMVQQAQDLSEQQKGITQKVQQPDSAKETPGIRAENSTEDLAKEFKEQADKLGNLLDKMQETVTDAESSEPLLADKLYDAFRETKQNGIQEGLSQLSQLSEQGIEIGQIEQTKEVLDQSEKGLDELKEKVESAAESVIGSETESLKRALMDLQRAEDEVAQELRRSGEVSDEQADAESNQADPAGRGRDGQQEGDLGNREGMQSKEREAQSDQERRGEGQPGDQPESTDPQNQENPNGRGQGESRPRADQRGDQQKESQAQDQPASGQQRGGEPSQQMQEDRQQDGQQQDGQQQAGQQQGSQQQGSQQQSGRQRGGQQRGGQQNGETEGEPSSETQEDREFGEPRGSEAGQPNQRRSQGRPQQGGQERGGTRREGGAGNFLDRLGETNQGLAPIGGDDFAEWSDRLRDIEETLEDPELQSQVARVREAARDIRREARKHAADPQWPLVQRLVAEPLEQVRQRVQEELLRKSAERNSIVPIDRDPVPGEFEKAQEKYYENLGSGRK